VQAVELQMGRGESGDVQLCRGLPLIADVQASQACDL
jgi:hypothetical protein